MALKLLQAKSKQLQDQTERKSPALRPMFRLTPMAASVRRSSMKAMRWEQMEAPRTTSRLLQQPLEQMDQLRALALHNTQLHLSSWRFSLETCGLRVQNFEQGKYCPALVFFTAYLSVVGDNELSDLSALVWLAVDRSCCLYGKEMKVAVKFSHQSRI
jgi:hypothetical protein